MKYFLLPKGIKDLMNIIKRVSLFTLLGAAIVVVIFWSTGFFGYPNDGILFSVGIMICLIPTTIPWLRYRKVSQSTVQFEQNGIVILDEKGNIWRCVEYKKITNVQIRKVRGFFYGQNKDHFEFPYICIFLNGLREIPQTSYKNLFLHEDFLMIIYQPETLEEFQQKANTKSISLPEEL